MATKIGLVGLGRMGRAIQARLKDAGFAVIGWDRDAVAMQAAAGNGMEVAAHPRAVADGSGGTVISIITEDSGVKNVFRGTDGFLSGDVRGKLFIEMSTLQPMTGRELAPIVEAKGARLIESPVLGTIPSVREGKLFSLAGGRAEDIERARVVLDKLAQTDLAVKIGDKPKFLGKVGIVGRNKCIQINALIDREVGEDG